MSCPSYKAVHDQIIELHGELSKTRPALGTLSVLPVPRGISSVNTTYYLAACKKQEVLSGSIMRITVCGNIFGIDHLNK